MAQAHDYGVMVHLSNKIDQFYHNTYSQNGNAFKHNMMEQHNRTISKQLTEEEKFFRELMKRKTSFIPTTDNEITIKYKYKC